ncbi:MAG: cellulase family glycosylhydrolase [Hyphomicrobiales bacterium]|nr:cellulase family glycosylhydrolase [Hyphomicrobiales bacterium]
MSRPQENRGLTATAEPVIGEKDQRVQIESIVEGASLRRTTHDSARQHRHLIAAAFVLACVAISSLFAGPAYATTEQNIDANTAPIVEEHPLFVSVQGRQFLTPEGMPMLLKGINLANWLLPEGYMFEFESATSPKQIQAVIEQLVGEREARKFWKTYQDAYITRDDLAYIKSLGFNSVRVPLHYKLFVSERDPVLLEGPGYALLDRLVRWSEEIGVYVILDMHAAPGGQTGDNIDDSWGQPNLFHSSEDQDLLIRLWQKLASRYKDEHIVAGYDLLNEPIAHFYDAGFYNPMLEPLYRRIVSAIREVDQNHIIFLSGAQWGSNFDVFGAPFDDKLAYTFHKYWTEADQSVIQDYVNFSTIHDVPLWMGESGENTDDWVTSMRQLLEDNDISWSFWPYKKMGSSSGVVSIPKTKEWDAIIAFANRPRASLAEIRKHRPAQDIITTALGDFLNNVRLENCQLNQGYVVALGMELPETAPSVAEANATLAAKNTAEAKQN